MCSSFNDFCIVIDYVIQLIRAAMLLKLNLNLKLLFWKQFEVA